MANIDKLYSGQGCVFSADRDSLGNIGAYRNVGNVSALQISLESDIAEHKETCSGSRLVDKRIVTEIRARVNMTLDSFTRDNLVYMLSGTARTLPDSGVAGATVTATNEILHNYALTGAQTGNIAVGDVFFIKQMNLFAVTALTDNSGDALTLGTHYTVDLVTGMITIISTAGGPYELPLKVTYKAPITANANQSVTIFTAPITKERALLFRGLNTADANKAVRVELYKVIFDPVQNFDLINDEFGTFELEGSVLLDSYRQGDVDLGGFGRVMSDSTL